MPCCFGSLLSLLFISDSTIFGFFRPEQVAVAVLADGGDAPVDDRVVDEEVVHARPVLAAVDVFFFVGVDVYLAVEVFAGGRQA